MKRRLAASAGRPARRSVLVAAAGLALAPASAFARPPVQVPDPPSGQALVVFFRRWEYPAAAVSYIVREGKADLGILSAGTYFIATVAPGLHTYTVHAERHADAQLEVDADEIYYMRFELDTGVFLYQPTLTPAEQRQFDEISSKLTLSSLPPELRPKP